MVDQARINWPGYILGFAFAGFFDGILLHQVLQWHHLLSNVGRIDVRGQIAADGYFHVLMYILALLGVGLLWRARGVSAHKAGRFLPAFAFGFGVWNFADIILFHWVLGIHHVRMTDAAVAWDVGWLIVFGVAPVLLGFLLRRRAMAHDLRRFAPSIAALLVLGAGAWSAAPSGPFRTALFAPGTSAAD